MKNTEENKYFATNLKKGDIAKKVKIVCQKTEQDRAITLIALIVTIIVLLILARSFDISSIR